VEDGAVNNVGCNVYRRGTYYEAVGVREVTCDSNPAYIYRKYIDNVGFARPIFIIDVEVEGKRRDVVEVVDEMVEDGIIEKLLLGVEVVNGVVGDVFYIEG